MTPPPRTPPFRRAGPEARPADRLVPAAGPVPPGAPAVSGGLRAALRRTAVPVAVLGGVVGAFCYVAAVDPDSPGHYPLCPLRYYTGLSCPGCGGLRGAHALAHGQLRTALGCNALAVAGYLVFAVLWAGWFTRAARGRTFAPALRPAWRNLAIALVIAFTVVRNLPFGAALAP
ncbi:DUF2752 domain-containing protein [Streptomyces polygonati]|uniref:DUF2752 domain-containing protein n=1 Tax=Streptomyces polygonati TaxID=1617087 RepID=A0ABV8HEZ7_9ACTN